VEKDPSSIRDAHLLVPGFGGLETFEIVDDFLLESLFEDDGVEFTRGFCADLLPFLCIMY
jgi:hypothetical protein